MKVKRLIAVMLSVVVFTMSVVAQTSGDKLYNDGLALQKTMTVKSQNAAIDKFRKAKKIYDSSAKKTQCDQAISVSQNIIKQLGSGSLGKGIIKEKNKKIEEEAPTLEISNSSFDISEDGIEVTVNVSTNQSNWEVYAVPSANGETFLKVEKASDNKIRIIVPANESAEERTQNAYVETGALRKEITVNQAGHPVNLKASKTALSFKAKGGKEKIDVYCDADLIYDFNSDLNWYVISKPEWIMVSINPKKKEGGNFLSKAFQGAKDLAQKGVDLVKGGEDAYSGEAGMVSTSITITCDKTGSGSTAERDGRKGMIVLGSGSSTFTIEVSQQPK